MAEGGCQYGGCSHSVRGRMGSQESHYPGRRCSSARFYGFPKLSARGYLRSSVSPYVRLQSASTRVNCWMACKLTSSKVDGEIQQVFVVQLTPLLPPTESISGRSRSKCANTQRPSTSPARLARGDSALIFLLRRPQHEPTSFLNRPCSCQVHEQLSPPRPGEAEDLRGDQETKFDQWGNLLRDKGLAKALKLAPRLTGRPIHGLHDEQTPASDRSPTTVGYFFQSSWVPF